MANASNKILLVEGYDDQHFFSRFLQKYCDKLAVEVSVLTPRDQDGYNSRQGALNKFAELTKGQAEKKHIGLVLDADYIADGAGCDAFLTRLSEKLKDNRFDSQIKQSHTGYKLQHPLHQCGVWIMDTSKNPPPIQMPVKSWHPSLKEFPPCN